MEVLTWAKAKMMKEALNGLIQDIWADCTSSSMESAFGGFSTMACVDFKGKRPQIYFNVIEVQQTWLSGCMGWFRLFRDFGLISCFKPNFSYSYLGLEGYYFIWTRVLEVNVVPHYTRNQNFRGILIEMSMQAGSWTSHERHKHRRRLHARSRFPEVMTLTNVHGDHGPLGARRGQRVFPL